MESAARTTQRETRKLRALRYDAGSLALNLTCTVGRRGGRPVERLRGRPELAAWLRRHDFVLPDAEIDDHLLESVRELREALHDMLHAAAGGGGSASVETVQMINARAGVHVPPMKVVLCGRSGSPVGLSAQRDGDLTADQVLALIAQDGIAHLSDEDRRARLAVCAAPDCRMLYLNATRGARRQWCSMSYCGNRAKAANHRARHASAPVPVTPPPH